jgi:methionyl-tRNA synthetase
LKDNALLEFEESILASLVAKKSDEALTVAESAIAKAALTTEVPSPAEIAFFATLYDVASTAKVDTHPALSAWFVKVLNTQWAKSGIEKVAALTTVKPTKISKGAKKESATAVEDSTPREMIQKLKPDVQMKIPKEGEDMCVSLAFSRCGYKTNVGAVFPYLARRTFLSPLPCPT